MPCLYFQQYPTATFTYIASLDIYLFCEKNKKKSVQEDPQSQNIAYQNTNPANTLYKSINSGPITARYRYWEEEG